MSKSRHPVTLRKTRFTRTFRWNSLKQSLQPAASGAYVMQAWRTMNLGAFIIILGLSIILVYAGPLSSRQDLFLPIILLSYGVWLILLALLKQLAKPNIYQYPPLMVGSWGILIGATGFLWISSALLGGGFAVLAFGILAVAVGVILVAYSLVKK